MEFVVILVLVTVIVLVYKATSKDRNRPNLDATSSRTSSWESDYGETISRRCIDCGCERKPGFWVDGRCPDCYTVYSKESERLWDEENFRRIASRLESGKEAGTRKNWDCDLCGRLIESGSKNIVSSSFHFCLECAENPPRKELMKKQIYDCKVVGISYENADGTPRRAILRELAKRGEISLYLEREPSNRYDENAIKVLSKVAEEGYQIGHVPRDVAEVLAPSLDNGASAVVRLDKLHVPDDILG